MDRNEAIKVVKSHYPANKQMLNEALEFLIPELKESEDEKAMEDLLNFLKSPFIKDNICDWKVAPWIAWIEKQKPIQNTNKEDEEVRQYIIRIIKQRDINVPMVQKALNWLSKQGV